MPRTKSLKNLFGYKDLIGYLRDELDWKISEEQVDPEEYFFDYKPSELGLDKKLDVEVKVRQLRPLVQGQKWGIFFVEFSGKKKLPIVIIRRLLNGLISRRRSSRHTTWESRDLLFITSYSSDGIKGNAFLHFHESKNSKLPTIKVIAWDNKDTDAHLEMAREDLKKLAWPDTTGKDGIIEWRESWSKAFVVDYGQVISSSKILAKEMAKIAKNIKQHTLDLFEYESDEGELHKLFESFKTALIHDLKEDDFADMFAQALAYGLFTARVTRQGPFEMKDVSSTMPNTNPFLRDLFKEMFQLGSNNKARIGWDEVGVSDLIDLFGSKDVPIERILSDFGRESRNEDPVIHFYEDFLSQYDKQKKIERGVFYTPDAVVSYIVRSVDGLLKKNFNLELGLADMSTWGEVAKKNNLSIPKHIKPDLPFVQILDPAVGTGTFLKHIILLIHGRMMDKWNKEGFSKKKIGEKWNEYVRASLLPRLSGFELMIAPYAICHMKLGLVLRQTGYKFKSTRRLQVYLTNSLEPAENLSGLDLYNESLSQEASSVNVVKDKAPITVIIGNPPYKGISTNKGKWISDLIEDYKYVDGKHFNERKHWLQDDYVKFIRFTEWHITKHGVGIIALITNKSYLDNPTFRGMRQHLIKSFDEIYILNLHGSATEVTVSSNGLSDENVFNIRQGVAISMFIKLHSEQIDDGRILSRDLTGPQNEKHNLLLKMNYENIKWQRIKPKSPYYFFVQKNDEFLEEYEKYWKVNKIFQLNVTGIVTMGDGFIITDTKETISDRLQSFLESTTEEDVLKNEYKLGKNYAGWVIKNKLDIVYDKKKITSITYRPFSNRWTYFDNKLIWRWREEIMKNFLIGENLGLISSRINRQASLGYFFVTQNIVDFHVLDNARDSTSVCPLYIYSDVTQPNLLNSKRRVSNISFKFIKEFSNKLSLRFISDGRGDLEKTFGPEDVFYYTYAMFHMPEYRKRYAEQFKIDFPGLPTTSNKKFFTKLVKFGNEIVNLHLLGENPFDKSKTIFDDKNKWNVKAITEKRPDIDWKVSDIKYDEKNKRVYVNKGQYFEGVEKEVWEFMIGGYQVCEKWLKDHKKSERSLSPDDLKHYMKIVVSLRGTIRIMKEIDEVIDKHGGWPIK